MIGIVIVCHGDLAVELVKAAQLICGTQEHVVALSLHPEDPIEDLPARIIASADRFGSADGVLVLVDISGGSPANAALRLLPERGYECVSGVNLPMLLEALLHRERMSTTELAARVESAGRNGIRDIGAALRDKLRQ